MTNTIPLITFERVTVVNPTDNTSLLLNQVSGDIVAGRITAFIGKSGAGKTTLLKTIAQLYPQYLGTIAFEGNDIRTFSRKERVAHVGFVFQSFNLFPHLTVLQNCMQPLMVVQGLDPQNAQQKVLAMLEHFGLSAYAHVYPAQLSGGQQQRIAIIRALCMGSRVLLLDEPTSALDPENVQLLTAFLKRLCAEGYTIVLASQDVLFVRAILDRAYFLQDGAIVQEFDAQKQGTPDQFIAQFVG